jgi:hypothetical protein
MELLPEDVKFFVTESNRIEGIHRKPTMAELLAHVNLMAVAGVDGNDLQRFVDVVQPGKKLRSEAGMNVPCLSGSHP